MASHVSHDVARRSSFWLFPNSAQSHSASASNQDIIAFERLAMPLASIFQRGGKKLSLALDRGDIGPRRTQTASETCSHRL